MAVNGARVLGHSGVWLLCFLIGCAEGEQNEGMSPTPGGAGGGATAGSSSQTGGSTSDAGKSSTGGGGSASTGGTFNSGGTPSSGGSGSGGTFASGGTSSTGGTFASSGTSAGGNAGTNGGGGATGGGGASAGGGGSANGGGGSGAGGKSGVACKSDKLTPTGATASGSERADLGPEFAIDADTTTSRWGSDTKNDAAWIMVDMGEPVTINRVVLVWEAAYATSFKLQGATSAAGPFTDFYSTTTGAGGTADLKTFTPAKARYVRMQGVMRQTMYGYSLFDFSVYGDKDETCD